MYSYPDVFTQKERVLFVTAHPDDLVVFFGALVHRLRQDGKEVYVLLATNGARGSRENHISEAALAAQRLQEEQACLAELGVAADHLFCLGYADGEVNSDLSLIGEVAYYIRKLKVDLVATHEPSLQYLPTYAKNGYFVQHRDHRQIGEAVIDAVYPFSRDRSFFPKHAEEGIEPQSVFDLLLTDEKDCNFTFDYTEQVAAKKRAMRAHKSQFTEETIDAILNSFQFDGKYVERFHYVKLLW